MNYRKERNFIVAYDGENCRGKWNILTNEFIGIKGAVVKGKPKAFTMSAMTVYETYNLESNKPFISALEYVHDVINNYNAFVPEFGARLEEIVSLGLSISCYDCTYRFIISDKTPLTKEVVDFIKSEFHGRYGERAISEYTFKVENRAFLSRIDEQDREWAEQLLHRAILSEMPLDFVRGMIIRGLHEKVQATKSAYDFHNILYHWYQMITKMHDTLEVKHNILTNYSILSWVYKQYEDAHYNDALVLNNDKPWLYFEDDTFVVIPLLSREAFRIEAEAQHNCVENMYMARVHDGLTHVVAVRRKSDKDKPFITCEVSNSGRICQYLYQFNNHVHRDTPEANFYEAYQEHLIHAIRQANMTAHEEGR